MSTKDPSGTAPAEATDQNSAAPAAQAPANEPFSLTKELYSSNSDSTEPPLIQPTKEERAKVMAYDFEHAATAISMDEPITMAVATEFIVQYSIKAADTLREGKDYIELLTPTDATPAVERIAMEIVRESLDLQMEKIEEQGK